MFNFKTLNVSTDLPAKEMDLKLGCHCHVDWSLDIETRSYGVKYQAITINAVNVIWREFDNGETVHRDVTVTPDDFKIGITYQKMGLEFIYPTSAFINLDEKNIEIYFD